MGNESFEFCQLHRFCQVRWSLYDSSFMNPTISQEELQKPLKPDDPRKFMRIKAARTDDTTLADYDPIIQWVFKVFFF